MYLYKNYSIIDDIFKMKEEKKSIVKEALSDYKEIMDAADANAKKKLAEEFPEKFNNLLKEELNKNKSVKESKKKLDETQESEKDSTELNKESVMKNQKQETVKVVKETAGEGKPFEEKAKKVAQVEEDVKITDTVGKGDPFEKETKGGKIVDETAGDGKPFDEKAKKPLQTEEFDVTELDVDSVGSALEGAGDEDEIITMDEIEQEIANMENLDERLTDVANPASPSYMEKGNKGIAFDKLVQMRNQLDEMIGEMHQGNFPLDKMHQGAYDDKLIDEKGLEEMHAAGATNGAETFGDTGQVAALHSQGPTEKLIDEEPITDDDVMRVLGAKGEGEVEESQTRTLANQKKVTAALPGKEYKQSAIPKMRYAMQGESEKKIGSLIEENKKLTKKVNETNKYKKSVTTLVESYKTALDKYRNQLKEMAVFNTNLAHVNNLLVNEELALTQEDKIKIINEFKKVDSITDSQKKYKAFLTEMKDSKKTLTESIEDKVSASIQPSSKQKLDEVVEKTAYENDEHIQRMKKIIETIEHRGKKIIQ
jgi:hypothetical protein